MYVKIQSSKNKKRDHKITRQYGFPCNLVRSAFLECLKLAVFTTIFLKEYFHYHAINDEIKYCDIMENEKRSHFYVGH